MTPDPTSPTSDPTGSTGPERLISPTWKQCAGGGGQAPHLVYVKVKEYGNPIRCQHCTELQAREILAEAEAHGLSGAVGLPIVRALLDIIDGERKNAREEARWAAQQEEW